LRLLRAAPATAVLAVISALVVTTPSPGMPELAADLSGAGIHVLGAIACDNLVQEAVRGAPDVVVCWEPAPSEPFFRALQRLQDTFARPVVVFTADVQAEALEQALDAGVQAWVVQGYAPQRLRPLVQLAQARFRRERKLHEALQDLSHRYEERKLVDRAKGLLMRARAIPEDEAFRLLRAASMQGKQRVGQVAQQVIDAARDAEAVNRAGQLRMLSQRLMKLYALTMSGTEAAAARALLAQSVERTEQQLGHLQRTLSAPTFGDLLQPVVEAFGALKAALAAPPSVAALLAADGLAERLLESADRLTAALQGAGPVAGLRVINVCGRQRMLSQRLAKQALLGALLPGEAAAAAQAEAQRVAQAFEQALHELEAAPLSTGEIRAGLASAGAEWQRMLQGVASAQQPAGRLLLAQASEALLALFEQLTERYEHSMQVLMG
jgi:AmiR/NasT family two-component response regulator